MIKTFDRRRKLTRAQKKCLQKHKVIARMKRAYIILDCATRVTASFHVSDSVYNRTVHDACLKAMRILDTIGD